MTQNSEIRCLSAPIGTIRVLVPGSIIAEVIEVETLHGIEDSPAWLAGEFSWQNWTVPVIDFGVLAGTGGTLAGGERKRAMVIKSLNNNAGAPYLGLLISGVPSMAMVTESELHVTAEHNENPGVFSEGTFNEQQILIPDVDELNMLVEVATGGRDESEE